MDEVRRRCSEQEKQQARNKMDYWKRRSNEEMFSSELGFSLIYDNIKSEYMRRALATMGLTRLPDVLLLVQVDDYLSKYSEMAVTREFAVKAAVWKCLQSCIESSEYMGFAANLIGLDTLICFLCLPEEEPREQLEVKLHEFASYMGALVYRTTKVSVTMCISDFCSKPSDFPIAYTRAREMLYNSFYFGKGAAVVSYRPNRDGERTGRFSQFLEYYPLICAAISSGDQERFRRILHEVCEVMHREQVEPKQSKATLAGLVHTMEVYCLNCGLENKEEVSPVTARYADLVLRCSYLEDTVRYLLEYYAFLDEELRKIPSRDQAQAFREPICEYVSNHYGDQITLGQIAEITGYSTYYLTRLFKKHFGCTLTEYLVKFRVERGKEMLEKQSWSVGEIASKCGFESANYFSICFKKHVGQTPSQYRRKQQALH